jgi:hypothetical protein
MPAVWIVAGALGSWAVAALIYAPAASRAVILGMAGPVVSAAATWILIALAQRRNPAGVSGVMMAAFMAKMVFFGVYVVVMLRGLDLPAVPFIVSFTAYFVSLYAIEAVMLRRLFGAALSAAR